MTPHFLIPSRELPSSPRASTFRQLASLILVAALTTSTFTPTRIPRTVGESRRVSWGVEARDPQVPSNPRSSQDPTTIDGRDRHQHSR